MCQFAMETIKIMKIIFLGAELFIYIQYKNYIHQHQLGFVFIFVSFTAVARLHL